MYILLIELSNLYHLYITIIHILIYKNIKAISLINILAKLFIKYIKLNCRYIGKIFYLKVPLIILDKCAF